MKNCLFIVFSLFCLAAVAQDEDAASLHATAKNFMKQGDYANAVLVLNKALEKSPNDAELMKDLSFSYYLERDYNKALQVTKKLLDRKDADVQTYQLAGLSQKATGDTKELDKLYKKGLKAFPNSGVLYNEYGELLWEKQDYNAIKQWEKGIEVEPNYPGNYYNAAKYYYMTVDKVWGLIYGEIFVNMESYSQRTVEIKDLLLKGYKKLFTDTDIRKNQDVKNSFVAAYLDDMAKQADIASKGITPETLIMIRTRFVLEWYERSFSDHPYRLFQWQQQLLDDGMFEAYNQWLFGAAQNLTAFQSWTNLHQDEYNKFLSFQKGRVFKMPVLQYYNR